MFRVKKGKTKFMWLPVTTSTAFSKGALVAFASGLLVPATNTQESYYIVGVIRHAIASTDSDYATARLVEVEVPVEAYVVWEADITDGTVNAVTDVGLYKDLATADTGVGVDVGASSLDICFITKVLSTTKVECILNIGPWGKVKA